MNLVGSNPVYVDLNGATTVALTLAGRVEFAVFGTVYFLTEIPLMLGATVIYRRTRQVP